jgi:hypothetical protein
MSIDILGSKLAGAVGLSRARPRDEPVFLSNNPKTCLEIAFGSTRRGEGGLETAMACRDTREQAIGECSEELVREEDDPNI